MPKRLTIALLAVAMLAVGGTVVAQSIQRFTDVPPDHEGSRLSSGRLRWG